MSTDCFTLFGMLKRPGYYKVACLIVMLIPSHFVYVLFIFFFLFFRGWSHPLLNSIGCLDMPRGAEINK